MTKYFSGRLLGVLWVVLVLSACSDRQPPAASLTPEAKLLQIGSEKARMCVGCHGPKGISRVQSYPSLAGKSQQYLAQELRAFRDGSRENPMMTSIARNIGDEDVVALSHYFSSLPGPNLAADDENAGNE